MSSVRVIVDPEPGSGSWNMAVDEALLESAVHRGLCTLRWYRWKRATLSLGYFQNLPNDQTPASLRSLPVVRRLSGGGAIVHHHEWTYSCAVPAAHALARTPQKLFAHVHRRIVHVLRQKGLDVQIRGGFEQASRTPAGSGKRSDNSARPQPLLPGEESQFLCFHRADANDVILKGHKILGSAQRRRRGAILQHGSLLWQASTFAPELPGILDLVAAPHRIGECLEVLPFQTGQLLSAEPSVNGTLTDEERRRADELQRRRYRDPDRRRYRHVP